MRVNKKKATHDEHRVWPSRIGTLRTDMLPLNQLRLIPISSHHGVPRYQPSCGVRPHSKADKMVPSVVVLLFFSSFRMATCCSRNLCLLHVECPHEIHSISIN